MAQNLETHLTAQTEQARRLFWHRLRWRAVRSWLPSGDFTLLDVGAGAGHVADYLAADRPGARYTFIEPLDSLRQRLRDRHGSDADFEQRPSFDAVSVITLLDVLEHQQDDVAFLRELAARMNKTTRLILTVPALNALWSSWDVALGHHRRYRKRTLRAALHAGGFAIEELSYLFPELLPSAVYRRITRRSEETIDLELPTPPALVNETLYILGRMTQRLRRFHPLGTSLLAVARLR